MIDTIDLTAGFMRLNNNAFSNTFVLAVRYNDAITERIEIRGKDELYALQYLINRTLQKLDGLK